MQFQNFPEQFFTGGPRNVRDHWHTQNWVAFISAKRRELSTFGARFVSILANDLLPGDQYLNGTQYEKLKLLLWKRARGFRV